MIKNKFALILPLAFLATVGCSGGEDLYAPVEAPEINNAFVATEVFSVSTQGSNKFFSRLTPAIVGNTLYSAGRDGKVYAFDATTGDDLWVTDLDDEEENDDKRSTRLSGGVTANLSDVAIGSENGYIYVLNAKDGSLKWKYYLAGEVTSLPAFSKSGASLYVQDARGRIFAFDVITGKQKWVAGEAPTSLRLRSQSSMLVVGDEYLVVGQTNGKVGVYLQETGALVNQITISQAIGSNALERVADISSTPLLLGSNLYATSYSGDLVVYSFAEQKDLAKLGYSSSQNMDFDREHIVLVDDKGYVYCIDRNSNQELWSNMQLTYRSTSAPAIYGNFVVVGDYEGYLYFLDINDGSINSMIEIDNSGISVAPLVHDGKLYVQANDGTILCLDYDVSGIAKAKEESTDVERQYAGVGVTLMAKGVSASGLYAPNFMTAEELEQRRTAIIRAVSQAEARQKAAIAAQKRAYEEARRNYERAQQLEKERLERLSSFGLMPSAGVSADEDIEIDTDTSADNTEVQAQSDNSSAQDNQTNQTNNTGDEAASEKASGFGL